MIGFVKVIQFFVRPSLKRDVRCVYASFSIAFTLASTSSLSHLHFMPYSSDVTSHSMKQKIWFENGLQTFNYWVLVEIILTSQVQVHYRNASSDNKNFVMTYLRVWYLSVINADSLIRCPESFSYYNKALIHVKIILFIT